MNYGDLQQQIARRLDNRIDLSNVIRDYSQGRINYWSSIFFYQSDIVDTSLTAIPGQLFYNFPSGIRAIRYLRLLLSSNQTGQSIGTTTTTASVTLPASTIPVVSTMGFMATSGVISVGGAQVFYNSVDSTDFLGCVGVAPDPSQPDGVYPAGTQVMQLTGVWLDLKKRDYEQVLWNDPLSPSNRSIPWEYALMGLRFRLFPVSSAFYPLEITGSAAPAPPLDDDDDNWWTEDAAWLVIASTANEIRRGYLHEEELQQDAALEKLELRRLKKVGLDIIDNTQIRLHL